MTSPELFVIMDFDSNYLCSKPGKIIALKFSLMLYFFHVFLIKKTRDNEVRERGLKMSQIA
jgi:hypothetical protein